MSPSAAKRAVILSMLVAGIATTARGIVSDGELPSVTVPIGIFVVGASLALVAEVAPEVAGGLAVLIIVSSILTGAQLWDAVAGIFQR